MMDALIIFLMAFAICVAGMCGVFAVGWAWFWSLTWIAQYGVLAASAYTIGCIAVICAIAITFSVMEST